MRKEMVVYVGIVAVCALFLGCATMPSALKEEVPVKAKSAEPAKEVKGATENMGTKIDGLITEIRKLVNLAEAQAPSKKEEAAPLSAKPEAAAPATPAAPPLTEAIADLQKRVGTLETKTGQLETRVGSVEKKVAGIKIQVVKVSRNAGISLGLLLKPGERAFLIHFKKGSSEIEGRATQEIKALKTLMKTRSYLAARFVSFADEEGFKGVKRGSPENETRNTELAKRRGNTVKDNLEEDPDDEIVVDSAADIESYGATDQFGPDHESNRVVVVVLKKNE